MFQAITDEIRVLGVREPAMVSWLTDQQKNLTAIEWRRLPIDIRFIKTIPNPYTAKFNYAPPNFNYFSN